MDHSNKRLGAYILICSILLVCTPMGKLLASRPGLSTVFFLETGKILPPVQTEPPTTQPETEQPSTAPETVPTEQTLPPTEPPPTEPIPTEPPPTEPPQPLFSQLDANLVEVNNYCGYPADLPAFLTRPLSWDLRQTAPTVLILHSHGSESYANTRETDYRTQNTRENVISVGEALAEKLETAGIRVIHDQTVHDYPSYSDAYENSRAAAKTYLEKYPSIALILDLHRDAVTDENGEQLKYTQGSAAKMMFVVGTDAGGLTHTRWPENMSLAVKLHAQLEKETPGICRPISFRTQRFNQDLSPGALLVEMGAAGNTRQEALAAAALLAEAIIVLATGTE